MSGPTKTPETLTAAARAAQLSIVAQGQDGSTSPGKISAADARARLALAVERPGNAAADLHVGDDLDGSTMVLPVDAVRTYEKNPRTKPNPKYLSIKESVRAQGITNQLSVTKRPGEDFYIPFGGGNTRVLVLQELWQETQDSRFRHLTVVYRKWRGHAVNIAAHLAENNNRGDTTFWETACGLWSLKQELEQETGRILSATELNKESRRLGMDFGNSSVQAFLFAVEYLAPVGPWLQARAVNQSLKPCIGGHLALCSQLGCSSTEARTAVDRVLEMTGEMLRSREANESADVDIRLDVDDLVRSLNDAVAQLLHVPASQLPLMLAARAANPRISAEELRRTTIPATPPNEPASLQSTSADPLRTEGEGLPHSTETRTPQAPAKLEALQLPLQPAMLAALPPAAPTMGDAVGQSEESLAGNLHDEIDPSQAPETVHEILADITRVADLADVVAVCDSMPLRYYVELPDDISTVDGRPAEDIDLRKAGWFVLAGLSGQFDRRLVQKLPTASRWRTLALGSRHELLSQVHKALRISEQQAALAGAEHLHQFFWHPELGELFLQLWSWAFHWRGAEPARFLDRVTPLFA